ncbi:MAG: T9SS type A sorting domain-containing protein [Candidatus Delongbacteria bacterium]|nr:T9SS type A sorting domain-containing protein [Candidatus Delongbacteria bacterium]MBN2833969.1 T9SS type A sorting domain-containing protein [Candidatus Delongbacteria bacterium]
MAAPQVAEDWNSIYGPEANNSAFFVSTFNWGGESQPYAYNLDVIDGLYSQFGNGYVPFFAVIGQGYKLYYGDNRYNSNSQGSTALELLEYAINGEIGAHKFGIQSPFFFETTTLDLERMFVSPTGNYQLELIGTSNEILIAELNGNILTVEATYSQDSVTVANVTVKATDGDLETTISYDFAVRQLLYVFDPLSSTNCMVNTPYEIDASEIFTTHDGGDFTISFINYNEELMEVSSDEKVITIAGVEAGVATLDLIATYEAEHGIETAHNSVTVNVQSMDGFWVEYGQSYTGFPGAPTTPYANAMSWDFGNLEVFVKKIETAFYLAGPAEWRIVNYAENNPDYDSIIGDLSGEFELLGYPEATTIDIESNEVVSGKISFCITVENNWNMIDGSYSGSPIEARQQYLIDAGFWMTDFYPYHIRALVQSATGTNNPIEILPGSSELSQNYPNPFNPITTINYYNNMTGEVELNVYNSKGEFVKNLVKDNIKAGNHSIEFNASDLNSGVYFYTLVTPTNTITKKMVLIK